VAAAVRSDGLGMEVARTCSMIRRADRVARKPRTTEDWIEHCSCCRTSSVTSVNLTDMPKPGRLPF